MYADTVYVGPVEVRFAEIGAPETDHAVCFTREKLELEIEAKKQLEEFGNRQDNRTR